MIKISSIKRNPDNPRTIKDDRFEKLKASLKAFPEMLEKRPIVLHSKANKTVLGGNMRIEALKANGHKEIPEKWVAYADEWTEQQRQEFIIKDNVPFGQWDWDVLANEWDEGQLAEWGLELPGFVANDPDEEWVGMPEFKHEDQTSAYKIIVHFANIEDLRTFAGLIGQTLTDKTRSIWFPKAVIESYADKEYK